MSYLPDVVLTRHAWHQHHWTSWTSLLDLGAVGCKSISSWFSCVRGRGQSIFSAFPNRCLLRANERCRFRLRRRLGSRRTFWAWPRLWSNLIRVWIRASLCGIPHLGFGEILNLYLGGNPWLESILIMRHVICLLLNPWSSIDKLKVIDSLYGYLEHCFCNLD